MRRWIVNLLPLLLVALPGCRGCNDDGPKAIPLLADAKPPPALEISSHPTPAIFLNDPLWQRAIAEGDDIDLASLADREGASGLLDAFEQGGDVGRTALRALPFAEDASVAYRRLAEVALLTTGPSQHSVLQAIFDVASQPRSLGERVDEGGRSGCAKALLQVALREDAPDKNRALAVSALRLPAFVGLVAREQVPTAYDSPSPVTSNVAPVQD